MHLPGNIGGFRLDALLSKGTSTAVHRASDVDGRLVCLKFAWTDEGIEGLLRQAALLRRVPGDVFPEVLGAGVEGALGWCAMEFIEGPTLLEPVDGERIGWMVARLCRELGELDRLEGGFSHGNLLPGHLVVDEGRLRALSPGGGSNDAGSLAALLFDALPAASPGELAVTLREWLEAPPDLDEMDRLLRRLWPRPES